MRIIFFYSSGEYAGYFFFFIFRRVDRLNVFRLPGRSSGRPVFCKARIFIQTRSKMLRDKASSLRGYVTTNVTAKAAIAKIRKMQDDIGTKK